MVQTNQKQRGRAGALFFILMSLSLGARTQAISPNNSCTAPKTRVDDAFNRCLSQIRTTAAPKIIQSRVTRCEKAHTNAYGKIEKRGGASCLGSQNRTEAKAKVFYKVNQQLQAAGVTRRLNATPGSDVLVWAYPAWNEGATDMQDIFSKAQSVYNPQLQKNNYQPLVGMAVPVIGFNSNKNLNVVDQYCPYAQTSLTPNTYLPGLKNILNTGGINTLIGIANIGQTETWRQQSTQSILACLSQFNGLVTGLMIDDEYNQLSTDQRNAMLDWCTNTLQNSHGRCGMVLGHGTTTTTGLITPRQDICMDYNQAITNTTCQDQNPSYSRNIFNEEAPNANTPLPFSILN